MNQGGQFYQGNPQYQGGTQPHYQQAGPAQHYQYHPGAYQGHPGQGHQGHPGQGHQGHPGQGQFQQGGGHFQQGGQWRGGGNWRRPQRGGGQWPGPHRGGGQWRGGGQYQRGRGRFPQPNHGGRFPTNQEGQHRGGGHQRGSRGGPGRGGPKRGGGQKQNRGGGNQYQQRGRGRGQGVSEDLQRQNVKRNNKGQILAQYIKKFKKGTLVIVPGNVREDGLEEMIPAIVQKWVTPRNKVESETAFLYIVEAEIPQLHRLQQIGREGIGWGMRQLPVKQEYYPNWLVKPYPHESTVAKLLRKIGGFDDRMSLMVLEYILGPSYSKVKAFRKDAGLEAPKKVKQVVISKKSQKYAAKENVPQGLARNGGEFDGSDWEVSDDDEEDLKKKEEALAKDGGEDSDSSWSTD